MVVSLVTYLEGCLIIISTCDNIIDGDCGITSFRIDSDALRLLVLERHLQGMSGIGDAGEECEESKHGFHFYFELI